MVSLVLFGNRSLYGPGVHSASNRNECRVYFLGNNYQPYYHPIFIHSVFLVRRNVQGHNFSRLSDSNVFPCVREVFKDSAYIKRPLLVCETILAFDICSVLAVAAFCYRYLHVQVTGYERPTHLHAGLCVQESNSQG